MVSMIPFGLLAGVVGGREVRITEIDESGFCFRTIEENISDSEALKVCFYDIKNGRYRELEIPEYDIQRFDMVDAELSGFYVKYKVTVKQKAYAEAVQRLLYQYNHYIHLKLEEDDSALAKSLTGYPGELDEVKRGSLEEQVGIWRRELTPDGLESAYNGKRIDLTDNCSQYGTGFKPGYKFQVPLESGVTELALEIDRPELYQEYLNSSLTEFSKKYAGKCIGICGSIILKHREATKDMENVEIKAFKGLSVNFARENHAQVIVRGLRAVTDFEFELQMAQTNRVLAPDIDTVFLTTSLEYAYLSSTIMKEVAGYDGDLSKFAPPEITEAVKKKMHDLKK